MDQAKVVNVLKDFIAGRIQANELGDIIDDWLFELRQTPDLSDEQRLLSTLELYLHEVQEGYRSWDEVNELVLSVIERNLSDYYVRTITLQSSATSPVVTITRALPVTDYQMAPARV